LILPGLFIELIFCRGFSTFNLFLQTVCTGRLTENTADKFQGEYIGVSSLHDADFVLKFDIRCFEDYNI